MWGLWGGCGRGGGVTRCQGRYPLCVTREPGHWDHQSPAWAWEHITRHAACHTRVTLTLASKHVTQSQIAMTQLHSKILDWASNIQIDVKSQHLKIRAHILSKFVQLPVFWWLLMETENIRDMASSGPWDTPRGVGDRPYLYLSSSSPTTTPGLWKWCLPYS